MKKPPVREHRRLEKWVEQNNHPYCTTKKGGRQMKERQQAEKQYYTCQDIMDLCFVSRSTAYKLIVKLNESFMAEGYVVPRQGIVNKRWADEKLNIGGVTA